MSIKRSNAIWEHSKQSGNALVLLLKLADNAADDGYCWPGIEHLAEKSRMSTRTVIRLTKKLEQDGELFVCRNRRHGNKYIVKVGLPDDEFKASLEKHFPFLDSDMCQNVTSEVTQPCHIRSDTALSQESSVTVNEPSHGADAPASPSEKKEETPAEPKGEELLTAVFGEKPEREPVQETPHWTEQIAEDWATWGSGSDEFERQLLRYDSNSQKVQRLGYEFEKLTGLHPIWDDKRAVKRWSSGLWTCLQEADGNHEIVLQAARELLAAELTVSSPWSVREKTRAIAALCCAPRRQSGLNAPSQVPSI